MIASLGSTSTAMWCTQDHSVSVEYEMAVLEEIRDFAVAGLNAFGHGGLEIGGILYGARQEGGVRLLACVELASEHALGPAFDLSEKDLADFTTLMEPPAGLETIGWFRSHTRSSVDLDELDRKLFDRFVGEALHIGLVVKPSRSGTLTASFFVRDASGTILDLSAQEFTVPSWMDAAVMEPPAVSRRQSVPARVSAADARPPGADAEVPEFNGYLAPRRTEDVRYRLPSRRWWLWAALAAIFLMILLSGRQPGEQTLDLTAKAVAPGQIRIEWNRRSAFIVNAASGALEIRDGDSQVTMPLDLNRLQLSSIVYAHRSSDVLIKMRIEPGASGATPVEESIGFLAALPPVASAGLAPSFVESGLQEASREIESPAVIRVNVPVPRAIAESAHGDHKSPPELEETVVRHREVESRTPFVPPQLAAVKRESTLLPPPPLATGSAQFARTEFLSTPVVLPPPDAAGYAGPRTGRLIWTGSLGRRGVVEIEGAHASVGTLVGHLPGVPLSIAVSPAEFSGSGLTVYSSDRGKAGRKEPPGRNNGWNATQFLFDPNRVRELVILEDPNPTNEFKRLVLRNDARNCSVVVLEWVVR